MTNNTALAGVSDTSAPTRQLSLYDSTCIIVGIIIGATIYESSPVVANSVPGTGPLLAVWLLGGVLSLIGALCYVELANAYPREGGDYVYITRAFGRRAGFLFAWSQLWIVRPGSIGAMAYVFARYAHHLHPIAGRGNEYLGWIGYAAGAIAVLSLVNVVGVREGKWTQNVLTTAKVVGLAGVAVVGLLFSDPQAAPIATPIAAANAAESNYSLAMILVLFAYGGWNEMAYVAAEVRDPKRNILRAMLLGTVAVTAIYIVVNVAFLHSLGLDGFRHSDAVAGQVLKLGLGAWGDRLISVVICVSALSAVNGQIFTGARIYYAMGSEHRIYAPLGRWNRNLGTPVWSLAVQAMITVSTVVGFGLLAEDTLTKAGFGSAFERMVVFTGPIFWGFLVFVGIALFVLRWREPEVQRPYRVPLYPLLPIVFCGFSLFMAYSSLTYAISPRAHKYEALWALLAMAIGIVAALFDAKVKPEGPDASHSSDRS